MKYFVSYRSLRRFCISVTAGCTLLQTSGCVIDQNLLINQIIGITIQTLLTSFIGGGV